MKNLQPCEQLEPKALVTWIKDSKSQKAKYNPQLGALHAILFERAEA